MDIRFEWRIRDVEQKAESAHRRLYELDALRRDVAGLERTNGELRADIDRLRSEIQAAKDEIALLVRDLNGMADQIKGLE